MEWWYGWKTGEAMRILAIEKEIKPGKNPKGLHKKEAKRIYELYKEGTIREIFFTKEDHAAVIIFEVGNLSEAKKIIHGLPLVKSGCIEFDVRELVPYSGYDRILNA
jgi:muconolactone delta-isomerase